MVREYTTIDQVKLTKFTCIPCCWVRLDCGLMFAMALKCFNMKDDMEIGD